MREKGEGETGENGAGGDRKRGKGVWPGVGQTKDLPLD